MVPARSADRAVRSLQARPVKRGASSSPERGETTGFRPSGRTGLVARRSGFRLGFFEKNKILSNSSRVTSDDLGFHANLGKGRSKGSC